MEIDFDRKQYSNQPLAVRLYKSDKSSLNVEDFLNLTSLQISLNEVITGESDLTEKGKSFLSDYYGFENIASLLSKIGGLKEGEYFKKEEIFNWLTNVKPLDAINFINRGK